MVTLYFTNSVFLAYLTYLGVEKKQRIFQERLFWHLLLSLFLSLYLTLKIIL